jgi:hypothetical protein
MGARLGKENCLSRNKSDGVRRQQRIGGQSLLSTQSEFVNRNYPIADPKSRLLSRGARRWNAFQSFSAKESRANQISKCVLISEDSRLSRSLGIT